MPGDVWNSSGAQEIRRSILDGDYSYCSRTLCPMIANDNLPRNWPNWQAQARSRHPSGINVGFGDGTVRFVQNSIAQSVWQAITGRNDGVTVNLDSF